MCLFKVWFVKNNDEEERGEKEKVIGLKID